MAQEHETATLAWLRAEGGRQIVLLKERHGELLPAREMADGVMVVELLDVRDSALPRCYNVITSAGTLYGLHGGQLFLLATPAQVESYESNRTA